MRREVAFGVSADSEPHVLKNCQRRRRALVFRDQFPPQVVNLKNDGKYTRFEIVLGQEFLRKVDFAHQHHLILNQPGTCVGKKDRVFLKLKRP